MVTREPSPVSTIRSMRLRLHVVLLGAVVATASGCIWPFNRGGEPPLIGIRNGCGVGLMHVELREVDPPHGRGWRVVRVSPLSIGVSHVIERRAKPEPLPKRAVVLWKDDFGREFEETVLLRPALRKARGRAGEALVFEIRPHGRVAVLIEANHTAE